MVSACGEYRSRRIKGNRHQVSVSVDDRRQGAITEAASAAAQRLDGGQLPALPLRRLPKRVRNGKSRKTPASVAADRRMRPPIRTSTSIMRRWHANGALLQWAAVQCERCIINALWRRRMYSMAGRGLDLYFHSPCFDGIASAVLCWDFFESRGDLSAVRLHPVGYDLRGPTVSSPGRSRKPYIPSISRGASRH